VECLAVKSIQSESLRFFAVKSVGANGFSYSVFFIFCVRKLLDDLSPTARGSPHNRKSLRTNSPETKKQHKRTGSVNCKGQKSLQFDDREKTDDFFRAVHVCNVV